jgi:hypothetical protein
VTPASLEPRVEYDRRIAHWSATIARGERTHLFVSNLRLGTATAAAVLGWLAFLRGALSPVWFVVAAIGFLVLLVVHALVLQRHDRSVRARAFYFRGLARMGGDWGGAGADGARFIAEHPYARDLDLFGPSSLFQLLTTARTEAGEETLADWLRAPASADEIRARQHAVNELRDKLDFREDLTVLAAEAHVGRTSALTVWAKTRAIGLSPALAGASAAAALMAVTAVVAGMLSWVGTWAVFAAFLVEVVLVALWRRGVHEVLHRIETPSLDLRLLTQLIERVEREPFTSPRLSALHGALVQGGTLPSRRLRRLQSLVSILDSTLNPLFVLPAMVLLVRQQAAVAIDRWHRRHGQALATWLTAIGELEALSSLATFAYEHPRHPFPTIADDGPRLEARRIAHPLLVEGIAVPNDVTLGVHGPRVLIVSGSNMSGKSTLLRAVGTNVVLALAGGPVSAAAMTVSPLTIGATLRVEDSLQAGISRFYAEILRIRSIVQAASGHPSLLFLLDEILHGTNSHDRRIGADAIVRALVNLGAVGLVTTHDLALTELSDTLGGQASNVHFEDRIEDGKMAFDYRMRDGVVEHSNALQLMRAVGLDV